MTSPQQHTKHPRRRIALCAATFVLAVTLGISIGYSERTPDFNSTSSTSSNDSAVSSNRTLSLQCNLVAVDAVLGTMTLDWAVLSDTGCNASLSPPCPNVNPNSTVDFYFDANTLTANTSGLAPSDNPPDMDPPIFRHNATAVYYRAIRNSLASFRTDLALFSVDSGNHGRSSLSTLQRYPFDEYSAQIFMFALDSQTGAQIGLNISQAYGVAVGFKTTAQHTPVRQYNDVISELITVSRSTLVQTYVIIIVISVWLITLMFMFATVSIICGYPLEVGVLVVPVATLFAITQLRASMPGAPSGFGAIVDYVGLLPCLALMSISASLTIGTLVFAHPDEIHLPFWIRIFGHPDENHLPFWERKFGRAESLKKPKDEEDTSGYP